jgi:hypothetical protein
LEIGIQISVLRRHAMWLTEPIGMRTCLKTLSSPALAS